MHDVVKHVDSLEKYSLACKAMQNALAEIKSPAMMKKIDKHAADIKEIAKRAGNKELEGDGFELRKRAERHLGGLLEDKDKRASEGGKRPKSFDALEGNASKPTLKQLDIDNNLAHRARLSRRMLQKAFEELIAEGRADIYRRAERVEISKANRKHRHQSIANKASENLKLDFPGPFPLIYADPPWKWGHFGEQGNENEKGKDRTPDQHYPTMTYDQIKNFEIQGKTVDEIASATAVLFLWCTSSNMRLALGIMHDWGFEYKTNMVWVKNRPGMGLVFRNKHEHLLYGTRGHFPGPQYQPASAQMFPRLKHSEKPKEFRKIIERMYPDFEAKHRLELFARSKTKGWTTYGNEA